MAPGFSCQRQKQVRDEKDALKMRDVFSDRDLSDFSLLRPEFRDLSDFSLQRPKFRVKVREIVRSPCGVNEVVLPLF
jgi:hypothetical protein